VIESDDWQPDPESVFWTKRNSNVEEDAARMGLKLKGPLDDQGRIKGEPLAGEPPVTLQPKRPEANGPVAFSVRVFEDGFKVTPRDGSDVAATQKTVIEAIFAEAFQKDVRNRLIVASETVRPPMPKAAG
jgi:hypothetical protein